MSVFDCIGKLKAARIPVTDHQMKKIAAEADRLENIYKAQQRFPENEIRQKAELDAIDGLISRTTKDRASRAAEAAALVRTKEIVKNHRLGSTAGLRSLLVPMDTSTSQLSVDNLASAIYARSTAEMAEFVERFRSKIPGGADTFFRSYRNAISDVVKSLHGDKNVSEIASGFAEQYAKSRSMILDRLERAGVAVNRLEDFGISHRWDYHKLQTTTKDDWVKTVLPRLDRSRLFDDAGHLLDDAGAEELVKRAYDNIIQNEARGGRGMLGETANELGGRHRKLHFKSGEDYLIVHERFGAGELYDGMMESLQELATDAALAETFGPKPDAVFTELNRVAQRLAADTKPKSVAGRVAKASVAPENALVNNEMIYNYLRGHSSGLGNPTVASAFSTVRNVQVASKLGSAALAAVGDQAFIKSTASLWGFSYTKVAGRQIADMASIGTAKHNRILATRLGQIVDWSHGIASAANRFSDVNVAGTVSSMAASAADLTIRSSGLAKMTRSAKQAFGLELNSFLTKHATKAYDKLPRRIQAGLEVNAISPAEWDKMRKAVTEFDGIPYLDPIKMDEDIAVKFTGLIHNEARQAVPEPGAEIRALMTGGAAAGSASREVRSTFFQFGAFPLTVMFNNWRRLLFHPSNQGILNKIKYSANLAVYGTLVGGVALHLKDLKDGKDLRDSTDPAFMLESMMQAGTFGLGFVVPESLDEAPGGEVGAFYDWAPPTVRTFLQASAVLKDTPKRIKQEKDPAKPAVDFITKNIPVDQWYTDLIKQRLFIDQLKKMSSKNASRSFKRQQTNLKKRTGQQYWWKPGTIEPQRAPKIGDKK